MEALGRAALFKYEADKVSSVERKVHEMCQLIIASPVGRAAGAQQPSQAGVAGADARRGRGAHLVTDENSLHALLKYKPGEREGSASGEREGVPGRNPRS
jgi:hypothetical protein